MSNHPQEDSSSYLKSLKLAESNYERSENIKLQNHNLNLSINEHCPCALTENP
jgi:hypothetical protein